MDQVGYFEPYESAATLFDGADPDPHIRCYPGYADISDGCCLARVYGHTTQGVGLVTENLVVWSQVESWSVDGARVGAPAY